ncbi:MAG TPA: VOC family protein [bacterium]|nr:VOC family protein [bacterium]
MNRVVHFDISADDPERAINFYTKVFGWSIEKWEGSDDTMEYWMITTGPKTEQGIDGGLMKRTVPADPDAGNNAFACTIDVEDIDKTREKIVENGGKAFSEKMDIPEVGTMQSFIDTEGNYFSVMQATPESMMEP